ANSVINLNPPPSTNNLPGLGLLSFAGGTWTGGTLTINGWTGTAGQPGADDKIVISSVPSPELLNAIRFPGFSQGAIRLASGEIVPPPYFTWVGLGGDQNWSTASNWLGVLPPLEDGSSTVVFDGNRHLQPVTDLPWNILNITFISPNGAF